MVKRTSILLAVMVLLMGCQGKQKEAKQIPVSAFVKMYVTALREDVLMKQYHNPEAFPDSSLDRILKTYDISVYDFKYMQNYTANDPAKKSEFDSLLKQAIETETLKSLNEKEIEKN
jgi:hypothetical protein